MKLVKTDEYNRPIVSEEWCLLLGIMESDFPRGSDSGSCVWELGTKRMGGMLTGGLGIQKDSKGGIMTDGKGNMLTASSGDEFF